jgi:hypothetical protein
VGEERVRRSSASRKSAGEIMAVGVLGKTIVGDEVAAAPRGAGVCVDNFSGVLSRW